jgi:hypothetical protein
MPIDLSVNPQRNNPNNLPQSKGQPLPPSIRHGLEVEMGADLSEVMIHKSHVPTLKGAETYRDGNNIHFPPGKDPYDGEGKDLLSHELAHVVQQAGNPSTNPAVNAAAGAGAGAGQSAEQQAANY